MGGGPLGAVREETARDRETLALGSWPGFLYF